MKRPGPRLSDARPPSWPAFLAWGAALLLVGVVGWIVLRACGIEVAGHQIRFHWCTPRAYAYDALEHERVREAVLRNEIAGIERGLLDPDLCGDSASLHCEYIRDTSLPEEIIVVLDASGSMRWSIDIPLEREEYLSSLDRRTHPEEIDALWNFFDNYPGEPRISVARRAIMGMARESGARRFRLFSFESCRTIRDRGVYPSDQLDRMERQLDLIRPDSGTNLSEAIRRASRSPGDRDAPVNMLVISDGVDNCGGDACEAARRAKAERPGLVINVFDLADHGLLQCLSESTGGVYRKRDEGIEVADISQQMLDAAEFRSQCVPRH